MLLPPRLENTDELNYVEGWSSSFKMHPFPEA